MKAIAALCITWILDGLGITIVGVIAPVLTKPVRGLNFSSPQIGLAGIIYIAAGLSVARVGDEDEMRDALVFGIRRLSNVTD
jgi:hypothetical protein